MQIKKGQGLYSLELKKKNNARIKKYFEENPDAYKAQACKDLGLSIVTLNKHLEIIKNEKGI